MNKVIKPYRVPRKAIIAIIIAGVILLLTSIIELLFFVFSWSIVCNIVTTALLIIAMLLQLRLASYFVEITPDELRYFMPKCKQPVIIKNSDIADVKVEATSIEIITSNGTYTVHLNNLMSEVKNEIKECIKQLAVKQ